MDQLQIQDQASSDSKMPLTQYQKIHRIFAGQNWKEVKRLVDLLNISIGWLYDSFEEPNISWDNSIDSTSLSLFLARQEMAHELVHALKQSIVLSELLDEGIEEDLSDLDMWDPRVLESLSKHKETRRRGEQEQAKDFDRDEDPLLYEIGDHGIKNALKIFALLQLKYEDIVSSDKSKNLYDKSKYIFALKMNTLLSLCSIFDTILFDSSVLFPNVEIQNKELFPLLFGDYDLEAQKEYKAVMSILLSEIMTNAYKYGDAIHISMERLANWNICLIIKNNISSSFANIHSSLSGTKFFQYIKAHYSDIFDMVMQTNDVLEYSVTLEVKSIDSAS